MQAHWQQSKNILSNGETLLATSTEFDDIRTRVNDLQQRWDALRKIASALSEWLQKAEKVGQYFQDANFAESWIK
jgi:uncharacterized protein YoxC